MQVACCRETKHVTLQASLGLAGSLTSPTERGSQLRRLVVRAPAEGFTRLLCRPLPFLGRSGVLPGPGLSFSKGFLALAPQADCLQETV